MLNHKSYGVRHVHRFVRTQPGTLGEKLSGFVQLMRRQNIYLTVEQLSGAGAAGPKIRKNLTAPKTNSQHPTLP